jgi:hypothetical protein
VAIIAVLISILVPSLREARDLASRVVCGANLRQLTTATLIYDTDYNCMLLMGGNSAAYYGCLWGNYSIADLYSNYLGGDKKDQTSISNAIRYNPADFLICPANPKDNYSSQNLTKYKQAYNSYGMYCGSVNDKKLTSLQATNVFAKLNRTYTWGVQGWMPALWADRCQTGTNLYGSEMDTNHRASDGMPQGGNVSHLDGSVGWYSWLGANIPDEGTYTGNGLINQYTKIPISSLFPRANSSGNMATDAHAGGTIYAGNAIFQLSDWY